MRWPKWRQRARALHDVNEKPARFGTIEVLHVAVDGTEVAMVCGLQWHTILGDDLHLKSRKKARSLGASHWVHAGGRSESVGVAVLPRRALLRRGRKPAAHAAAQLFARSVPAGIHVLGWELPAGRCWLGVARDGQVLGQGDLVVPDAAAARAVLATLRERFGVALQCHGKAFAWQAAGGPDAYPSDPTPGLAGLLATIAPSSALQPLRPHWRRLPVPVAVLLLFAIALGMQAWWKLHSATRTAAPDTAGDAVSVVDAEAQWNTALALQRDALNAVTRAGMRHLWRRLGELPARYAGWRMTALDCERVNTRWQCTARIQRADTDARVDELAGATVGTWKLQWHDLDQATASFELPAAITEIVTNNTGAQPGLIPEADTLQSIRLSLHRIELGPLANIPVSANLLGQLRATPRPAHLPVLAQRPLLLQGPWRSIVLATELLGPSVAWQRFSVDVADVRAPTLRQSAFVASLQGVRYENQLPQSPARQDR